METSCSGLAGCQETAAPVVATLELRESWSSGGGHHALPSPPHGTGLQPPWTGSLSLGVAS